MPTKAQIAAQVKLEKEQINQGVERLRSNTKDLECKEYASASVYGCSFIQGLLPEFIAAIESERWKLKKGHSGHLYKEQLVYLNSLSSDAAALITCKVAFDKIFSTKPNSNRVNSITTAIGAALEAECQLTFYEETVPGLLKYIQNQYWHASSGTHHKLKTVKTKMGHKEDIEHWKPWSNTIKIKLGGHFLNIFTSITNWFEKKEVRHVRHSNTVLQPTPKFIEERDKVMELAELYAPLLWPMYVPPNPWEYIDGKVRPGGYLLNELMKGNKMVRHGKSTIIQGETPRTFLNQIQEVGYRVSPFIFDVAETLEKRGHSVGKFIPIVEAEMPNKPLDIAEKGDSWKEYNRLAAEAHNANSQAFRRSCRTRMTMEAARRFKDVERYYIPWSFDYRGRVYPIPSFLTPQDTDFGKSLIRFADESPLTPEAERWLAFQCATTFGLDKATMEERLQWTKENLFTITRVAEDPLEYRPSWEGAEEPWQFLAACDEYYHCCIMRDRNTTGLPVAIDATCSGLQILAGLARDKKTAQLVNVVPADRPKDAYKVVAEVSKWNIPDRIRNDWDRKCVKRTVMTIPYNAKPFSNRSYIRDALLEKKIELEPKELTNTVQAVRDAMNVVVPGPMEVMKWVENEVKEVLKVDKKYLEWKTPSGFIVHQEIMEYDIKKPPRIQLKLLGGCTLQLGKLTDKPNIARHKAATAPNLIHSLDASLLHLAVTRFDKPIALIHDSVLCRASDMDILDFLVRQTYVELFANRNYLKEFAQQIGATTEPPIIGDLKPETVMKSTYFFC